MTEIRAFVGHSFTPDDADLVNKFNKYFDQLSKSNLAFSWEHAEPAEPKILAEKVMGLLSDKNVFIGICTKKERVISPRSLTSAFMRPSVLRAQEKEFSWKTSDWIIQEIGLAKGRGLDLILLVENGVRKPGGLQGDVEYIPFDRTSPEKSFGKIVEMITALLPKVSPGLVTMPDSRSIPAAQEIETETAENDVWADPKPDWDRRDYEIAYCHVVLKDDEAGIEKIDQAYQATDAAANAANKISWEAFREYAGILFGSVGNITKLAALAETNPDNANILIYLAKAYEEYEEYLKAAETYEKAANKVTDDDETLRLSGLASADYMRAELRESALSIITKMKIQVEKTGNGELQLLEALNNLVDLTKDDELALAIMERIVEVDPSNTDTRFSLAYKHSQCENYDLALFHYLKIPIQKRDTAAWNNLGVAFDKFSLPAKSVSAYRKAEEMGETLAMSNLAQKLISGGFLSEAQQQCDAALAIPDYHKNIVTTLASLKAVLDEEKDKESELLEKAKPKSDFYKQLGRAISRLGPKELGQRWQGPDCVLDVTLRGQAISAVGSYEQALGGLGLFGLAAIGINEPTTERYRVEYKGTLRGRTIEASVTRKPEDATRRTPSLLNLPEDGTVVLMVINDNESEIRVMENPRSKNPKFYVLTLETTDS